MKQAKIDKLKSIDSYKINPTPVYITINGGISGGII